MSACILLAGGLGTRLRDALPGLPKCLAPVGGTPFLEMQIACLASQGIQRFVLALGHRADQVIQAVRPLAARFRIEWNVEPAPLGTGGAALFSMARTALSEAIVANADTLVHADIAPLLAPALGHGELIRMLVAQSDEGSRFGGVAVAHGRVERFMPADKRQPGLANAGMYRIHRNAFASYRPGQRFSLEADLVQTLASEGKVTAAVVAGSFIDIGVPADYRRFCGEFGGSPLSA